MPITTSLRCPSCLLIAGTTVTDTRAMDGLYIRRRRTCDGCGTRWTTYETTADPWLRKQVTDTAAALRTLATQLENLE